MTDIHQMRNPTSNVPQLTEEGGIPIPSGNSDQIVTDLRLSTSDDTQLRRPWSSSGIKTALSPSPIFTESRRQSKDDGDLDTARPSTPKRPAFPGRGLSLQMPPRDISSTSTANLSTKPGQVPVSPILDAVSTFTSPTSVLPRRSRGMDFSRAATNLHHSTLAEQSSPESSPTVGGRRGMMIPPRKGLFNTPSSLGQPESPSMNVNSLWTTIANPERMGLSSSVASSSMMGDDSSSSSSDGDDVMDYGDEEDDNTIHMTPHINGMGITSDGAGAFSPAASKLINYQRARVNSRRSRTRNSTSSTSGPNLLQSPIMSKSPPIMLTTENSLSMHNGFLLDEPTKRELVSRRESLSLGTNDMQLSDTEQSDDGKHTQGDVQEGIPIPAPLTPSMEERKQVVRRAVTRRGNMLPKSRPFARIKAALLEEGAPVDTEVRREAEVIRQVRESEPYDELGLHASQPTTNKSSPYLGPMMTGSTENPGMLPTDDLSLDSDEQSRRRSSSAFTSHAMRNSGGVNFWNNFDERMRTPPPPMVPRSSSSGISDDITMDTPQSSVTTIAPGQTGVKMQETSSFTPPTTLTVFDNPRKGNKRMRDDDFDPTYFKRRAVSPGLSVQNSPVLPQSPGWWDMKPKTGRDVPTIPISGDRAGSTGSMNSSVNGGVGGVKRIGMQGMNDTNDSLMNMSIE